MAHEDLGELDGTITLHAVAGAVHEMDREFGLPPFRLGDVVVVDHG